MCHMSRRGFLQAMGAGVPVGGAFLSLGATHNEGRTVKDEAKITMVQLPNHDKAGPVLKRMERAFAEASDYGSDLVVFPEYVLGNHIPITDGQVEAFRGLARDHHMYAIAGLVESHGDRWATTALVIDRSGNLLGRYFKTHPASGPPPHFWPPVEGSDHEARGILGNQFKVFHLDFAPIGILQCYDGYFPEAWGCTSFEGAEIILWINGRDGMIEDSHCIFAAQAYGCVVGANITNGFNTGFASPGCIHAEGRPEQARLFPRATEPGDACVHATVNLRDLRWKRKHLRTMHQRRPEMYHRLTEDVKIWQDYPDIPWDYENAWEFLNRSQL